MKKRVFTIFLVLAIVLSAAACGSRTDTPKTSGDTTEVIGDYYIDLTELGMKLTIFLRIADDGTFLFSNTTSFEVNKSAGTLQKAGEEYLMVYTSVNGEEKSISEGIASKFVKCDDGSLDFTVCERIYYGTASATTTSADHPGAKLIAHIIPENYEAPSDESNFSVGTYTALFTANNGAEYTYHIGFYDDNSYFVFVNRHEDGRIFLASEVGRYGVSTTQLALNPQGGNRVSCDVVSDSVLSVSVPVPGSKDRTTLTFEKDTDRNVIASFTGDGKKTGANETFTAQMTLYSDGSFAVISEGFAENGLFAPDSETGTFKIYPDHPTDGTRGANQVTTVPAGTLIYDADGKLTLSEFRVRISDSLNRDKCTFVQE